jgi:hypothetical protein
VLLENDEGLNVCSVEFCRSLEETGGCGWGGGADVQNLKENAAAKPTSGCEAVKPLGDDDLGAEARGHGLSEVKLSNAREDCRSEMI